MIVSDTFTRADNGSSLGTADTGQAWSALLGTWGIVGNKAYVSAGSNQSYAVIDSALSNCTISVTLSGDLSSGGGITFRALDSTHLWFIEVAGGNSYLYRCNGGGPSNIATLSTAWSAGDVMTVVLAGNDIKVKKNGTQVFSYTDSTFATYTKHGLRGYGGSARLDDFSVDALPTVTGSSPVDVYSSSAEETIAVLRTTGVSPVDVYSSDHLYSAVRTFGTSPVSVYSSNLFPADFSEYLGEEDSVRFSFELSGIMDPEFPPPSPPVNFDGLADPTTAPTLVKSTTSGGHLPAGTYRYSYAAWKGSQAQATAPSPSADITLTTENTVTLTYPTVAGADGYLVYREDL